MNARQRYFFQPSDQVFVYDIISSKVAVVARITLQGAPRTPCRLVIHLTSRIGRILFGRRVVDTVQLKRLRNIVVDALSQWTGSAPQVVSLDARYMPTGETN